MSFLYFAYGSNMFTKRMHINCPSAKPKCIAKLKDFKLTFCNYSNFWKGAPATIVETASNAVWGVVWEISHREAEVLDRQESGYDSIQVKVESSDGCEIPCKTYKIIKLDEFDLPSLIYKSIIIRGAEEFQLPSDYIKQLQMVEDNGIEKGGPVFD